MVDNGTFEVSNLILNHGRIVFYNSPVIPTTIEEVKINRASCTFKVYHVYFACSSTGSLI